jgi:hypothetical protein
MACRDNEENACPENAGPDLQHMVANDIDCFFGTSRTGPFIMNGIPRKEMVQEHEVNWVEVQHFSVACVLNNNDINATAFAVGIEEKNGCLSFEIKVHPHFWRWFFSRDHVLAAVRPKQAKTRTLVRLAYKSLDMRLPFDDGGIDAESEKLPFSHKEKLDRLNQDWPDNPLSAFTIHRQGTAYKLAGTYHLVGDVHHPPTMDDEFQE